MIVPSGNMHQRASKGRLIGYAIGVTLALLAVVWRLVRYSH
jgi:hypothetical protein